MKVQLVACVDISEIEKKFTSQQYEDKQACIPIVVVLNDINRWYSPSFRSSTSGRALDDVQTFWLDCFEHYCLQLINELLGN